MSAKISFTVTVYKRDAEGVLHGDGASTVFKGDARTWFGIKQQAIDFAFMHEAVGNHVCQVRYTKGRSRSVIYKTPNFNGTWRV
jgi:hypothetical protein